LFVDVVLTGELLNEPKPPGTGTHQTIVSFAEGTHFERDKTGMVTTCLCVLVL